MTSGKDELISIREAARRCGRNMETVRRWVWSGKVAAEKLGNQLFIKTSDLSAYCRETAAISHQAARKEDPLEQAVQERRMSESQPGLRGTGSKLEPGSRAEVIRKMRELRQEIRTRVGNLDVDETIEQLREERLNELTGMR